MMELASGDDRVGDSWEGNNRFHATNIPGLHEEGGPEFHAKLLRRNLVASGSPDLTVGYVASYSQIDAFIFCWSTSSDVNIGGTGSTYDTCIRTQGLNTIAGLIWKHGKTEAGQPVSEIFRRLEKGRVEYNAVVDTIEKPGHLNASAFRKRAQYKDQKEYRFALEPINPIERDSITIHCPPAGKLLSLYKQIELTPAEQNPSTHAVQEDSPTLAMIFSARDAASQAVQRVLPAKRLADGSVDTADLRREFAEKEAIWGKFDNAYRTKLARVIWECRQSNPQPAVERQLVSGVPLWMVLTDVK
jgi:hypothetical protein